MAFIELKNINKIYGSKETKIVALENINFELNKKELVVILGPSGAGKTTLLNVIGGMDRPTTGDYFVDGKNITDYNNNELAKFRREKIGFVFQFYNLMANLTALENVSLATKKIKNALDPKKILEDVGLGNRLKSFPANLSGGEQQRVSIARALVKNPAILLCDEPTGALDSQTGKKIIELLKNLSHNGNSAVVIVTHNANIALVADRVIRVRDGRIIADEINPNPKEVDEITW